MGDGRDARLKQVGVFAASFLGGNAAFMMFLSARRQGGGGGGGLGRHTIALAALGGLVAVVPSVASGWRLGEHLKQPIVVASLSSVGVLLGVGLFRRRLGQVPAFHSTPVAAYVPLGISFASVGLAAGFTARRYVDGGEGIGSVEDK